MTLTEFLILLLIAGVVGLIGQLISGFFIGGLFISIIVGFVGALIGVRLADALGLPEWLVITVGDESFPIIWSIIGAALLATLVGLLIPRREPPVI
ncbi:MAG: hypothetical protein AAGU78_17080 [Chloroflexota bacterium]|nr:hypothetical protein [Anaerolineae bacterium]